MNTAPATVVPFNFHQHQVRVVTLEGEPWFVAADVCRVLGMTNPTIAVLPLAEDEKAKKNLGFGPHANLISESGLYKLIMRAHRTRPEVAKFQDWVTREVLPSIRKTGAYVTGQPSLQENPSMDPLALLMAQAQLLPKMIEQMQQQRAEMQAQAHQLQEQKAEVEEVKKQVADVLEALTVQDMLRTLGLHRSADAGTRVKMGRLATDYCRERGLVIKQHPFSGAGVYPIKALQWAAKCLKLAA